MSRPALVLPLRCFVTSDETAITTSDENAAVTRGRPRKHADAAARQRAYRDRNAGVVTVRLDPGTVEKCAAIATAVDLPMNELINQMVKFALSNRDWRTQPVFGRLLPNAQRKGKRNG